MKASVIIPVRDGLPVLKPVLAAVLAQECPWSFEVVVVDSGSVDGSLEHLRSVAAEDARVRVFTIEPREFGHGRTRNMAVGLATGEFVAVITQDAQPCDGRWLARLVGALEACPDAWGAFGRHVAWPGASPVTACMLDAHFAGCRARPALRRAPREGLARLPVGERQALHFFSDNNACLRRDAWMRWPYPEVVFGEDQLWARGVLERGGAVLYVDDAPVWHSHDFGPAQTYRRAREEARYFLAEFGYDIFGGFGRAPLKLAYRIWREWRVLGEADRQTRQKWRRRDCLINNYARIWGEFAGVKQARVHASAQSKIV